MRELTRAELVRVNVEIMKDIHIFCMENNIQYSLGYGTLLGAVRHKGMIPWDDDADLIMPRPSYEKFISTYKSSKYKLLSCHNNGYELPFARVSDENTFKQETTTVWKDTGIAVDIYPVDGKVPEVEDRAFYNKIKRIKTFIRIKSTIVYKHDRGIIKNFVMLLLKICLLPLNLNKLCILLDKFVQKYDFSSTRNVGSFLSPYGMKDYFPKNCFDDYIMLPFENFHFKCIKDYHQYLSNIYGDYMTPPSEKDKKSGHGAIFYCKKSFMYQ